MAKNGKHGGYGHNEPPDEPTFNARSSDPETSHIAAIWSEEKQRDKMTVWATYKASHPYHLATFEMEARLDGARDGKYRKRRSDLTRDGWLIYTGVDRVNPKTKKRQRVYRISDDPQPPQPKIKKGKADAPQI